MTDYVIKYGEYDAAVFEKVVGLFRHSFPNSNKFTKEYLIWQYLDNPNGTVVSYNAWTPEGDLVAHYAAIPIKMVIGGYEEQGLLSLNTATHPEHQGRGLFVRLASATYEYAKENGYKFVIGVANGNSTHGFLKRLGFELIAPLDVKVGWGNAYANGVTDGVNHIKYDRETLLWRLRCPQYTYTAKAGTIYGNIDKPFFHTSVAKIPEGINPAELGLKKTFDIFNLYVGIGAKLGGCYFTLPKIVKRSPFNLIFKDLTNGELPRITKDNIFFQLLDYDVA